jgi:hypothetical protein
LDHSPGALAVKPSGLTLKLVQTIGGLSALGVQVAQRHTGCRLAAQPVLRCLVSGTAGAA